MKKNLYVNHPSVLALYGHKTFTLSHEAVCSVLKESSLDLISFKSIPGDGPLNWTAECIIRFNHFDYTYQLSFTEEPVISYDIFQTRDFSLQIDEEKPVTWQLAVKTLFNYDAPTEWQQQLKILSLFVTEAAFAADHNSLIFFSTTRLSFLAKLPSPPHFSNLYKQEILEDATLWAHTHGLSRCRGIELEMMGLKHFEESMSALLDCCASHLIIGDLTGHAKGIELGPSLRMRLLPWQQALKFFPSNVTGGLHERQDSLHRTESLVLYAKNGPKSGFVSPDCYISDLRAGKRFLAYPASIQRDAQINALYLWPKALRFCEAYGGRLKVKALISGSLNWYEFDEIKKGSFIVRDDQEQRLTISEGHFYDWRLIAGQNIYGPEDFFQLNESIAKR